MAAGHIVWILYDILLTAVILFLEFLDSEDNPSGIFIGVFIVFIAVHLLWNMICLCIAMKSGKRPNDFLIFWCIPNACGAILHFLVMLAFAFPLASTAVSYAFNPLNRIIGWIEVFSYILRVFVVSFVGCCCKKCCLMPEGRGH